ncbi:probable 37S ribosomal protein S5, mitochondrial, partial [Tanacetum coccineum]
STQRQFTNTLDSELFQTTRIYAGSLRYYGLGLENGNYTVNLWSVELQIKDDLTWGSLGRRVFDIYLQAHPHTSIEDLDELSTLLQVHLGGQHVKYTVLVVCGNYHGIIGFAKAKGEATSSASQKAHDKCFQKLHYVERHEDHIIAYAIQTSYKKTKVYLWPGPTQGGMKAQVDFVSVISAPHTWSKWKIKCDAKRVRKLMSVQVKVQILFAYLIL